MKQHALFCVYCFQGQLNWLRRSKLLLSVSGSFSKMTVNVIPQSQSKKPWQNVVAVQYAMLTHHTRLTGIRGAGVPRRILLQHSVGHQTTRHKRGWHITFNPLQAPGYPLLPVKVKRQRSKMSRYSEELVLFIILTPVVCKDTCSFLLWFLWLLPQSISSTLKLNIRTGNINLAYILKLKMYLYIRF